LNSASNSTSQIIAAIRVDTFRPGFAADGQKRRLAACATFRVCLLLEFTNYSTDGLKKVKRAGGDALRFVQGKPALLYGGAFLRELGFGFEDFWMRGFCFCV